MAIPGQNTLDGSRPEPDTTQSERVGGGLEQPELDQLRLIAHSPLKLRLRMRLEHLQGLLDRESFWARGRRPGELRRMLTGSQAVVSAWHGSDLVGFGRATSDGVFRAVLWDVVVASEHQGQGLGSELVAMLLRHRTVSRVERVYLMTTNSAGFYTKLNFHENHGQKLMVRDSGYTSYRQS
jgi:ribosomal protein S18 acetylase RimI-like enzyme